MDLTLSESHFSETINFQLARKTSDLAGKANIGCSILPLKHVPFSL